MNPLKILDNAIEKYNPKYVIGLFSGGHDSLVATHIASRHPRFSFAAHFNTGIGIEETRIFVRHTCSKWGIELKEYKAADNIDSKGISDPQRYKDLVCGNLSGYSGGFPGPPMHTVMFNRLKERPLRMMLRDLDRNRSDKTMLVTGARKAESHRRNANFRDNRHSKIVKDKKSYIDIWEGTKLFCFPILDFNKTDITRYIRDNNLDRNPVVDKIHMSGECLCGAYAHEGELEEIRFWFPEVAEEIEALEEEVATCGFPWKWEDSGPPSWWKQVKKGAMFLPGLEPSEYAESILCSSCKLRS